MTESLRLTPVDSFVASIRPPGSKSITNRAFLCAALASGTSTLENVLDSRDTRLMADALFQLGVSVQVDWPRGKAVIEGCRGKFPNSSASLYVENSGTTMRFLAAALAVSTGQYRLTGSNRMHERPIGDLIDALRYVGVDAIAESPGDCPPVSIRSSGWKSDHVDVWADTSSQFASGLMLAAPCLKREMRIGLRGAVVSRPYLEMTAAVMKQFGVEADVEGDSIHLKKSLGYRACQFAIEPDATAASYFLAAAAITGGEITIEGLGADSIQGDVGFANCLENMGCVVQRSANQLRLKGPICEGIDVDMSGISDTVPTLAIAALFADGPTTILNVSHIRVKESDRIGDLARELNRLGAEVEVTRDGMRITPRELRGGELRTYDDHRLAMSLSLVGLRVPGIRILDPDCVAKTYPRFFEEMARVTGTRIHREGVPTDQSSGPGI